MIQSKKDSAIYKSKLNSVKNLGDIYKNAGADKGHEDLFSSSTAEYGLQTVRSVRSRPNSSWQCVSDSASLVKIAATIRASGSVALDLETYGPRRGDGLDPWAGDIRLLSLRVDDGDPILIDLRSTAELRGEGRNRRSLPNRKPGLGPMGHPVWSASCKNCSRWREHRGKPHQHAQPAQRPDFRARRVRPAVAG